MSDVDPSAVADAVDRVRSRIRELGAGRTIELVAVTKGFGAAAIDAAVAAGCTMIGENYAQELRDKWPMVDTSLPRPQVHFIGQLQTNKVRTVASIVDVWQSVDRTNLADEIARRAPQATVFVQVNTTEEPDKGGCAVSDTDSVVAHCRRLGLCVEGLMTVGPTSGERAATHAAFALLDHLAETLGVAGRSMGMTADMDIAIEHGATHVRIGSALFGARPHRRTQIG